MHSIDRSMCDMPLGALPRAVGHAGYTTAARDFSVADANDGALQRNSSCSQGREPWTVRGVSSRCLPAEEEHVHVTGPDEKLRACRRRHPSLTSSPAEDKTTRPAPVPPLRLNPHRRWGLRAGRHAHARESGTRIALIQTVILKSGRPTGGVARALGA